MKKSNLHKLAEFIIHLNVDFLQTANSYILCCTENQYSTLTKVLLFYCTEFKIQPSTPVDAHFKTIYIIIDKNNIIL